MDYEKVEASLFKLVGAPIVVGVSSYMSLSAASEFGFLDYLSIQDYLNFGAPVLLVLSIFGIVCGIVFLPYKLNQELVKFSKKYWYVFLTIAILQIIYPPVIEYVNEEKVNYLDFFIRTVLLISVTLCVGVAVFKPKYIIISTYAFCIIVPAAMSYGAGANSSKSNYWITVCYSECISSKHVVVLTNFVIVGMQDYSIAIPQSQIKSIKTININSKIMENINLIEEK